MEKKSAIILSAGMLGMVAVTGIFGAAMNDGFNKSQSDTLLVKNELLKQEIVDTICSVSGKTMIKQTDIDRFNDLGDKLMEAKAPTLGEENLYLDAASQLYSVADSWEIIVDMELPKKNAAALVTMCDGVTSVYNNLNLESK